MSVKSTTCSTHEGKPLSEYDDLFSAQDSADYENLRKPGLNFMPYKCSTCGKYHIRPKSFFITKVETVCPCFDSRGYSKESYPTKDEAQKVANIRAKSGVYLRVYECPYGNGWHLTSH